MFCYTILVCSFGFYVLAGGLAFLWNIISILIILVSISIYIYMK